MFFLTKKLKEWISVPVMTHCHNDFGLATACTMASVKGGAHFAHVTVNGLGEKTGNTDLAEVALASPLYGVETNLNLQKIYPISKLVEKISKIQISPLKPIVGENVFKRESGLAVAQLVNYPPAVEGYAPELLGRKREILLGKKSGKSSVEYMLKEMGVEVEPPKIDQILNQVKELSLKKKGPINQKEFEKIVAEVK